MSKECMPVEHNPSCIYYGNLKVYKDTFGHYIRKNLCRIVISVPWWCSLYFSQYTTISLPIPAYSQ